MPKLVVYLDVAAADAEQVQKALSALDAPGLASADVRVEGVERSLLAGIDFASITLTLTALGGAAGAAALLLDKVRDLVKSVRGLRQVLVETRTGAKPIESVVGDDLEDQG
jgi:hypothetical protein